jgi:membrane-associated protease RseP (regulator of RpoE activity)
MIEFFICLLITVSIHEAGHMFSALKCGMGVDAYSIGFGKILCHKKIKGIDYRLSLLPLGGYCNIRGMDSKESSKDFGWHPYQHKFMVLIAGVTINFLIAFICYLINYGSIKKGIMIDWELLKALFTKDYTTIEFIFRSLNPNLFLVQLSLLNFFAGVSNLIPIFPLDGGYIWYCAIEDKLSKGMKKFLNIFGWILVIGIQVWVLLWVYLMR